MNCSSEAARRRRVLVIAEAANPEWASVPLIGWNLSRALAEVADVHLVTQVRNRDAIARAGWIEGREFTAIDNEGIASPLFKLSNLLRGGSGKGWTTVSGLSALAYYSFERELWRQFEGRVASGDFDLVHRITPLSPTSPSIIAKRLARLEIPFVIGPLNGGLPWPSHFADRLRAEREWLSYVRWLYKLMPGYRSTRRYCAAIIAGSKHTYDEMPRLAKSKCIYIPENAVAADILEVGQARRMTGRLRGGFVGRLVPYKGVDILLESAAEFLQRGDLQLHIIGDGPERGALQDLVKRLNIGDSVCFHGWLPHAEVQKTLADCHFMAFPSIREFGGGVVVESMALGVTPIVADYGGPSELVDDETGIRVPFTDKKSLVDGMRRAIETVIRSPSILDTFGAAARRKVREKLTWNMKAKQIASVYEAVLNGVTDLSKLDPYGKPF